MAACAPGQAQTPANGDRTAAPAVPAVAGSRPVDWLPGAQQPRNVILILSDDHRYDFMGFMESAPDWLETPALDRMRAEGLHVRNAFVTTSLCSPSRASIQTGQYAHRHGVVDNTSPVPPGTRFFPQALQQAGWRTALVGKWHMGEHSDDPQPGFDHWVSFQGQGTYTNPTLNVNGRRSLVEGYTTELLTDSAIAWLGRQRAEGRPFYLQLSHKAVHAEFVPSPEDAGRYADEAIPYPATMANTPMSKERADVSLRSPRTTSGRV